VTCCVRFPRQTFVCISCFTMYTVCTVPPYLCPQYFFSIIFTKICSLRTLDSFLLHLLQINKFWEEVIACFVLVGHGQHSKWYIVAMATSLQSHYLSNRRIMCGQSHSARSQPILCFCMYWFAVGVCNPSNEGRDTHRVKGGVYEVCHWDELRYIWRYIQVFRSQYWGLAESMEIS
jgi:hypothetical protein